MFRLTGLLVTGLLELVSGAFFERFEDALSIGSGHVSQERLVPDDVLCCREEAI